MTAVVLDSEGFSGLARVRSSAHEHVKSALRAAYDGGWQVAVPAAVLAEQYRGGGHDQVVDACLGRHSGIAVVDTGRELAHRMGNLLARAGLGSEAHVDASTVAAATALGGGIILTNDDGDVAKLADGLPGVHVEAL